ncbi:hypothetical protein JTE90_017965 [Oedothorax gibbosus]|uniref:Uncharacterized protein n=1 Tax=Oedothorax gibbosus TaxID=931172 RepID=A0AAV6V6R3_9ARAC|nr:hypothetical protein JTE90_017965 [Oedothorax gibbosus]
MATIPALCKVCRTPSYKGLPLQDKNRTPKVRPILRTPTPQTSDFTLNDHSQLHNVSNDLNRPLYQLHSYSSKPHLHLLPPNRSAHHPPQLTLLHPR